MTSISTITPVTDLTADNQSTCSSDRNNDTTEREIQTEREAHEIHSQERMEKFENILCNNSLEY